MEKNQQNRARSVADMMADVQEEAWLSEFYDLEVTLSVYQLYLLLNIAAGSDAMGVYEPVWPWCTGEHEKTPLYQAPIALTERTLVECTQARALERLGFIDLDSSYSEEGPRWALTAKGKRAVNHWGEILLEQITPPSSEAPSTT